MKKSLQLKLVLLSAICYLLSTALCGCQSKTLHRDTQVIMGTFVEVISPDKEASNIVFTEIRRVENLLSKYKEDSEIAKLNKLGKLKVGPDTFYVLQKAKDFWQLSDGMLDITVGPLLDIWGFSDKKYYLPKDKEIKQALSRVGFDKIIFNVDDNMVKFKIPGMKIDLGGIAKGYAVDCAVRKLKEHQIKSCLINAGGQIYCLGDKFGRPWRIAMKNPRGFFGTLPQIQEKVSLMKPFLELKDMAVSTSGDYEQYFMNKGKRYAHIFNPKTGYPSNSGIVSVTVIAPDGLTADALSTSVFILGKDKGLKLVQRFKDARVEIIEERDTSPIGLKNGP